MRGFKVANEGPPSKHLLVTMGQIVVFWSTFLAVIPAIILRFERWFGLKQFQFSGQHTVAVVGFILASCIGLWSGITMSWRGEGTPLPTHCPRKLVVSGPYRYVRNPMACAGLAQGFFVGVFIGSWITLVYVVSGFFVWNYIARPLEEDDLRARFGDEFESYRRHVRCWIPRIRPRS